jgi:hypothetical protein
LNCVIANCFNAIVALPDEIPEKLFEYLVLNQEIYFQITEVCYSPLMVYGLIDKKIIKKIRKEIPLLTCEETVNPNDETQLDDFFVS